MHGRAQSDRPGPGRPRVRRRRPGRGVTLIELLVVLAILSLLMAILLPATERTQEIAKRIKCGSQLGQIATAGASYATEHNRRLVKMKGGGLSFNDHFKPYITKEEMYHCPAAIERANNAANGRRLDYGINHYGRPEPKGDKYLDTLNQAKLKQISDMTVIYFSDAETDSSPEDIGGVSRGTWEWPIQYSFQRYAHKRHLWGYCAASIDGASAWYADAVNTPYNEKWFIIK